MRRIVRKPLIRFCRTSQDTVVATSHLAQDTDRGAQPGSPRSTIDRYVHRARRLLAASDDRTGKTIEVFEPTMSCVGPVKKRTRSVSTIIYLGRRSINSVLDDSSDFFFTDRA